MKFIFKKTIALSIVTSMLLSNVAISYGYQAVSTLPYEISSSSAIVPIVTLPAEISNYETTSAEMADVDNAIDSALNYYENTNHNVLTDYADTLAILSANGTLSGYTLPDVTTIDESSGSISAISTRIILLNAMGLDPRNTMGGRNLVDELINLQNENGEFYSDYPSITQHMFAMIALHNSNGIYDVDKAVDVLYDYYKGDVYDYGAPKRANSFGDCDTTGFALIALAPFKDMPKAKELIDGCLEFLRCEQLEDGGFAYDSQSEWFMGTSNSNSTATVISGLVAIGEDVDSWEKNGKTPIDALLTFQNEDGSFSYEQGYLSDTFSFNQSLMALGDYKNNESVYNTIHSDKYVMTKDDLKKEIDNTQAIDFDLYTEESVFEVKENIDIATEVYNDPNASEDDIYIAISLLRYSVLGLEKIEVTNPDSQISVNEEIVTTDGETILSYGTYNVDANSTVFELLEMSLNENNIPFEYRGSGNSIYISKIGDYEEFGQGVNSGFEYYVNGVKKSSSSATCVLNDGDSVKWVYTTDYINQVTNPNVNVNNKVTVVDNIGLNYDLINSKIDLTEVNVSLNNIYESYLVKPELSNFEQIFLKLYTGENNEAIVKSIINSLKEDYRKPTDLGRVCLTLQIYDQDITDINGRNLYEELKYYENLGKQGINGYIYALFVATNENDEEFINELIGLILQYQNDDGGFSLDIGNESDVDITAMAIQALSKYVDIQEVNDSVFAALQYLELQMTEDLSSESISQIVLALTMLGIDINDSHFVTDKNLVERLLDYQYDEKSYYHSSEEVFSDDISTEQAAIALVSVKNNYEDVGTGEVLPTSDEYLTRQEFLVELADYVGIEIDYSLENVFVDLPDQALTTYIINTWYKLGVTNGVNIDGDLYFNPNELVTKQECSVFISRYFEMPIVYRNVVINDEKNIDSYAKESVYEIVGAFGYDVLDENGNFNPKENVKISEVEITE